MTVWMVWDLKACAHICWKIMNLNSILRWKNFTVLWWGLGLNGNSMPRGKFFFFKFLPIWNEYLFQKSLAKLFAIQTERTPVPKGILYALKNVDILPLLDVIFSDSDAIWLQDPLHYLSELSQVADVVASRAWYPQRLFRQWYLFFAF